MAVNEDYDQYIANSHEQAMKETRVEVAKIEAKRDIDKAKIAAAKDIKVAKVNNEDRKVAACVIAFFLLVGVIAGCITYGTSRPSDPDEQRIKQEKYELCMSYEKKDDECL